MNTYIDNMDTKVRLIESNLRIEGLNGLNPAVYCDTSDMKRKDQVTTVEPDSNLTDKANTSSQDTGSMDLITATQYGALGRCHIKS